MTEVFPPDQPPAAPPAGSRPTPPKDTVVGCHGTSSVSRKPPWVTRYLLEPAFRALRMCSGNPPDEDNPAKPDSEREYENREYEELNKVPVLWRV